MTAENNYEMIRNSSLAAELSDEQCRTLSRHVSWRSLADNEVLMREGEIDNQLYVIVSGSLAVTHGSGDGDWIALHLLRPTHLAGALGFLDGLEHCATLRAVGPTIVYSLRRDHLESMLDRDSRLVYLVMRAIIREVHGIVRRMNIQQIELSNYISKQHGRY